MTRGVNFGTKSLYERGQEILKRKESQMTEDRVKNLVSRHADEITEIIQAHIEKQKHLAGHDLINARRACSTAIAEACQRHIAEATDFSRSVASGAPNAGKLGADHKSIMTLDETAEERT